MNDIVIPLCYSAGENEELKYTLRSIEKNVKNYRDIWIVGHLPEWIHNVRHIPFSDAESPKFKDKNIRDKFLAASINLNVSENFLATNDDIYVIDEIDATDYLYFYKGGILSSIDGNKGNYKKVMTNTYNFLVRRGFAAKNFDTHCPIIYNKELFKQSVGSVDYSVPYGYGVKSLYCALNRVEPYFMPDCKIRSNITKEEVISKVSGRDVFSTYDDVMDSGVGEYLSEMFPEMSRYEKK